MAAPPAAAEFAGDDKAVFDHKEALGTDVARDAAERGHLATDQYGHALVEFDKKAESRLRWKIDLYIVPTVALMYLFCFIDRANIGKRHSKYLLFRSVIGLLKLFPGNAKLAGFNKDLGLEGYDYNAVLSIFFVAYIIFEIPSNVSALHNFIALSTSMFTRKKSL